MNGRFLDGTTSSRASFLTLVGVVLALLLGGASAFGAGGSNSAVAHLCQHDGWVSLIGDDGAPFASEDACVAFGAHGGTILPFTGCFVVDTNNSSDFSNSSLAAVVAAASPGDTLDVKGTCTGSATIGEDLTVAGAPSSGYGAPTLQGSAGPQLSGVLTVASGSSVGLNGLTIERGNATVQGGGIDNSGTLTLTGSTVTGNSAGQVGGGIINYATLTLDDSTISANTAGNGATSGNGGGIENLGSVTLNGTSSVEGNSASFGGGVDSTFAQTATLTLNGSSSIDRNSAHIGGGVDNFVGAGASTTVTLNDTSSIDGNTVDTPLGGYGAGIFNGANLGGTASVTLNGSSSIAANDATAAGGAGGLGGGIYNTSASATSTANVSCPSATASITRNNAEVDGGGIFESGGTVASNCTAIVSANTPNNIG
jgi:hypothetical protein